MMALTMDQLMAAGDDLYARDQWGRVWRLVERWAPGYDEAGRPITRRLGPTWELTAPPPGTVWVDPGGADAIPTGTVLEYDPRR